jgi:hypothetical protein
MSTALIACVQSTPASLLSSTSASSSTSATTTVTVESGTGSGTYTYQWTISGTTVTLTNGNTVSPTFTYAVAGTTTALCNITDTIFGTTVTSPNFVITWSSPLISTTFTFTPSVNTSYTYDGTTKSITVTPNPAGATYGVTSGSLSVGPGVGSTSAVVTANGSYTGSATSPTITINTAPITAMTWNLNGVSFTSNQSRASGTTYTITVASTTPSAATNSPVTASFSAVGGPYTLTSTGTGNYSGSFTSPQLTITSAVVIGSITESSSSTINNRILTATLTGATATGYAWVKLSGVGGVSGASSQTCTVNSASGGSTTTTMQCTISYSGGSVAPTYTWQWNII